MDPEPGREGGTFTLLHIDEHLLVTDKPAGLLAVLGRGEAGLNNLASRVQAVYPSAMVVHRLDMATSGLMLMALGAAMQRELNFAFAERKVHKTYIAVVEGELAEDSGEIDAPMAADWPNRPRQKVDATIGKPSLSRWRVLSRGAGCTRVELEPVTGRSHQLRVHMQHIGHPIRGDEFYAPEPLNAPRLLLHATTLQLQHPATGAALRFESAPPF
jgi:tRNA pseudouridine32 synthase/23S rRNA pseudouridine746 synthase